MDNLVADMARLKIDDSGTEPVQYGNACLSTVPYLWPNDWSSFLYLVL